MKYFNRCPFCGANLDPSEICDCIDLNLPELVSNKKVADGTAIPTTANNERENVLL